MGLPPFSRASVHMPSSMHNQEGASAVGATTPQIGWGRLRRLGKMKEKNKLPLGYAQKTEPVVTLCKELIRLTNNLLETTRNDSQWQRRSVKQRIKEAKTIKEVAKSLYEIVSSW